MEQAPLAFVLVRLAQGRGCREMVQEGLNVQLGLRGGCLQGGCGTGARDHRCHGWSGHGSNCNVMVPGEDDRAGRATGESVHHDFELVSVAGGTILIIYKLMAIRARKEGRSRHMNTTRLTGHQVVKSKLGILGQVTRTEQHECACVETVQIRLHTTS